MKEKLRKYSHGLLLLYFPVYLAAFSYIEKNEANKIHIIECTLDHQIPFVEFFVVPYFLWFLYIAVGCAYFFFKDKDSFEKFMCVGMFGMTIFIVVSLLYPNGLQLRPTIFARDNIFVTMTKYLYSIDTSTNVFPSIHVYNSLAMHYAIAYSEKLSKHKAIQGASLVLCVSIILATMFLKQHSVFDVVCATTLFMIAYGFVYGDFMEKVTAMFGEPRYDRKAKLKGNFHA